MASSQVALAALQAGSARQQVSPPESRTLLLRSEPGSASLSHPHGRLGHHAGVGSTSAAAARRGRQPCTDPHAAGHSQHLRAVRSGNIIYLGRGVALPWALPSIPSRTSAKS
jgi:hypothetical protein